MATDTRYELLNIKDDLLAYQRSLVQSLDCVKRITSCWEKPFSEQVQLMKDEDVLRELHALEETAAIFAMHGARTIQNLLRSQPSVRRGSPETGAFHEDVPAVVASAHKIVNSILSNNGVSKPFLGVRSTHNKRESHMAGEEEADIPVPRATASSRSHPSPDGNTQPTNAASDMSGAKPQVSELPPTQPPKGEQRLSRKRQADSDNEGELSERMSKHIRITDEARPRRTIAIEIKKHKAASKVHKRREEDTAALYADMPTPETEAQSESSHAPDTSEYEDVSAEVEARLKAKEAKRLAVKGDMKRKRSSDSLVEVTDEGGVVVRGDRLTKRQRLDVNVSIYSEE